LLVNQAEIYELSADETLWVTPREEFGSIQWDELDTVPDWPSVFIDGRVALADSNLNS